MKSKTSGSYTEDEVAASMRAGYYTIKFLYSRNKAGDPVTFKWEHTVPNEKKANTCPKKCHKELPDKAALIAVLSGNPGRLSVFSIVSGEKVLQIPIPGVTKGITAPTRFDTNGKIIYINTNDAGLHILDSRTFKKIGSFQYPPDLQGKGNDIDHVGTHKLALVANGDKGLGVADLTDLSKISILHDWDNPMDLGSANRVRLFGGGCTVVNPTPNVSPCSPLFKKPYVNCGKAIGFLADGLAGLKIFELTTKEK